MSKFASWLFAGAAALAAASPAAARAEPYRFHFDHVLGTSLDIVAVAPNPASALMAAQAARREITRLDAILSDWREDSELSALNRGAAIRPSPELAEVLDLCDQWRGATGGAFDCRVGGALHRLRTIAASGGDLDPAVLRQGVEARRVTVDGLAKGYVIDAAMAAARRATPDLGGLLIDIGGDLRCWGRPAAQGGWRVGVADAHEADNERPGQVLRLKDQALAVSGRGARDLAVGGCMVSHVIAPATGRPAGLVRTAAVVARSAVEADALSTAFMATSPDQALALADRIDGDEAWIVDADGRSHVSAGWSGLVEPQPRLIRASTASAPAAHAAKGVFLDLTYTVPKIDAEPYHAPYVVMWITDENRKLVRTLLVLGNKPKWAPENFIWWRRYGRLAPQVLDTVGRATRPPGRYSAHWDGKDEHGATAPPGRYILHIEASREKGGHTYQTLDLDLSAAGAKALPAKDEMGAVELKFGPGA